jgi:uncharacterized repeat protein (TIGR01451 family)
MTNENVLQKIKQGETHVIPACFKRGSRFPGSILKSWIPAFAGMTFFMVVFCLFTPAAFANVLGNPDFEQPLGDGTANNWADNPGNPTTVATMGRWTSAQMLANGFAGGPRSGSEVLYLQAYWTPALYESKFTFQTYNNVKAGDYVVFSAYAQSDIKPTDTGGFLKIEFENSSGSKITFENEVGMMVTAALSAKITSGSAPAGTWVQFIAKQRAPEGAVRAVFVMDCNGIADAGPTPSYGNIVFDDANAEVNATSLVVTASKRNVSPGDSVGINAHFTNNSLHDLTNVEFRATIPPGFDYAAKSIRVNGNPATYRDGSLIITVPTIPAGDEFSASFVTLVTSGIQLGHEYTMNCTISGIVDGTGGFGSIADTASVKFQVEGDPVFDQGTIIGKVFNDLNQNTVQDCGEPGIPWVRLYTEEGIGIVTDENGLYHIPGVTPGRHIVKIDGHSLPDGTKFITEEAYLVKTTPGIMNKANFAVLLPPSGIPANFEKDLTVMVTQGVDVSRPTLDIQVSPDVVKLGVGVLEKEPVFTFDNNYGKFIKKWTVEVRDPMGQPVWTGYGVGQPPPEVTWSGITESGLLIKPGIYSYQLKVRDAKNREDWTALKFFEVMTKQDPKASPNYHPEIPPVGDFNLFKDGKRSIPLVAKPVVRVQGKTQPKNKITINDTPVTVDGVSGMFQKEFFVEPGEYDVAISATTPEGEATSFTKKIKVKDSTFFMVALGEEQLGINEASGAMEAADSEVYRDGFREEGRMSFFLKGKLKGKFLVKAKYDTSDKRSALFTNLNPDDYYPIYGDNSTRDYQAQDTAQKLFILIEMDRSYAQWGSFKTEFTDTELATYNRTLSGLKVNFDTVSSTTYGDPKRGFKVFSANSDHRADHNELYATGGSLFYTRNRNIIEGSEKIRVEIRDKIQNMTVASYDLQEGTDYEINYEAGRIFLSRPLSSVAAADTMTSTDILDGDPVYLIVDYEYDPTSSETSIPNQGIRGYTWIGDHLRVGATGVEEQRVGSDYDMVGVDGMLKLGRNTKLTAEYARTIGQQMETSLSYDGGISYADLGSLSGVGRHAKPQEDAYLIRGSSEPVKNLETTGYVQGVNPGFSNGYMRDQEGLEKYGVAARYKFTDSLAIRYRFDHNAVLSQLEPLDVTGTTAPFQALETQTAQIVYDDGKYLAELEYQNRNMDSVDTIENLSPALVNQIPFNNGVTGKLGYHLNDRLLPYVKVQTAMGGKNDQQFGGGLRYELVNNLFAYLEEMVGPLGDSTYFGFERQHGNGARSYANIRSIDRGIGDKTLATAIGNSFALTEKSRMYSEREYSSYQGSDGYVDILGYEGKAGDHWDYGGKYERRHLANSRTVLLDDAYARNRSFNTMGASLAYANEKKFRARTYWEVRLDGDVPKENQIVTRNSAQYQLTEDLGLLTYFNYGATYLPEPFPDNSQINLTNFMELSTGFAYRPIKLDKLNILARYSYMRNIANDMQVNNAFDQGVLFNEIAQVISTDIAYDVNRFFGLVEKLAWKHSSLQTQIRDSSTLSRDTLDTTSVNSFLTASRINFHVTRKWDLALEYRILMQSYALDTFKQGALVEVDREFYEYVRLGVGYNFTDFSDDLRDTNNFKSHGPFVRMTGKF